MNLDGDDDYDPREVPPDQRETYEPGRIIEAEAEIIPMHDEVGHEISVTYRGIVHHGKIIAVSRAVTLIHDIFFDEHFTYDAGSCEVRKLTDRDRCTDCGGFLCQCQQQNQVETKTSMKPVPFSELEDLRHDDPISCVEGVITAIFEPKSGRSGKGKYFFQNFNIKDDDGTEFRACFADSKFEQEWGKDSPVRGKLIRVTAKSSGRNMTGIVLKHGEGDYADQRTIHITATATLEFLGAGREPQRDSSGSSGKQEGRGASSGRSEGGYSQSESKTPVEDRIQDYFDVMEEVVKEHNVRVEKGVIIALTPEAIKDITTGLVLGFKGQYGVHAPVIFAGREPRQSTEQASGSGASLSSWEKTMHPKSGRALGEYKDEEFVPLAAWALFADSEKLGTELKHLKASVLMGIEAKKWTPRGVMNSVFDLGGRLDEKFTDETLDEVLKEKYGASTAKLTDDNVLDVLKHSKDIIATAIEIHAGKAGSDDDLPA